MVQVERLIAVDGKEYNIKFLGQLLWFTITDLRVTLEQLKGAFRRTGIDESYLPKPINPRDAFRKASTMAEVKGYPLGEGKKLNLLVREVKQEKDLIIRQLVREVVDAKNVRLEYLPVAKLELSGEKGEHLEIRDMINGKNLYPIERKTLDNICVNYEREKENYNGQNVRDIIMRVLRNCNPVAVRPSGGVYFVPKQYRPTVDSLKELVRLLNTHKVTTYNCEMWSVPVVDAEEQRAMVRQNLEEQVMAESKALLEELADLLKAEHIKIRTKTAQKYIEQVRTLAQMVREYEDLLDTKITTVKANLDLVKAQAMALLEKAETEAA
ncbi:MAG: DUF6744 family protein [Moorellaceae bacterium]